MTQWTIARRILLGNGLILSLLIIAGAYSIFSVSILRQNANSLKEDSLPGLLAISDISESIFQDHISSLMAVITKAPEDRLKLIAQGEEQLATDTKALAAYEKTINLAEDRKNFDALLALKANYDKTRGVLLDLIKKGKDTEAVECINRQVEPAFRPYQEQLVLINNWNSDFGTKTATNAIDTASSTLKTIALLVLGAVIAAIFIIAISIRRINSVLTGLAGGLADASAQVSSASTQVAGASQTLAGGASEQAASLEETSASVEELTSMAKRNSENAVSAQSLANESRLMTSQGAKQMERLVTAMNNIKTSSDNIARVVKTIDEIAFQTNILALNAAVEAARAGEAGAGFAVVADEVRSLAQRAAQASRETAGMIEESIRTSSMGAALTGEVAGNLAKIDTNAVKVGDLVNEITTASKEQAQGFSQISVGVTQMDKVTQSNAANAEETASAAEELSAQSLVMQENVEHLLQLIGGAKKS